MDEKNRKNSNNKSDSGKGMGNTVQFPGNYSHVYDDQITGSQMRAQHGMRSAKRQKRQFAEDSDERIYSPNTGRVKTRFAEEGAYTRADEPSYVQNNIYRGDSGSNADEAEDFTDAQPRTRLYTPRTSEYAQTPVYYDKRAQSSARKTEEKREEKSKEQSKEQSVRIYDKKPHRGSVTTIRNNPGEKTEVTTEYFNTTPKRTGRTDSSRVDFDDEYADVPRRKYASAKQIRNSSERAQVRTGISEPVLQETDAERRAQDRRRRESLFTEKGSSKRNPPRENKRNSGERQDNTGRETVRYTPRKKSDNVGKPEREAPVRPQRTVRTGSANDGRTYETQQKRTSKPQQRPVAKEEIRSTKAPVRTNRGAQTQQRHGKSGNRRTGSSGKTVRRKRRPTGFTAAGIMGDLMNMQLEMRLPTLFGLPILRVLLIMLIFGLACWFIIIPAGKLAGRMVCTVRNIRVYGNTEIEAADVISYSGLKKGLCMFDIDDEAVERQIAIKNPYLDADVKLAWPDRIKITVEKRLPYIAIDCGSNYLIADKNLIALEFVSRDNIKDFDVIKVQGMGSRGYVLTEIIGDKDRNPRVNDLWTILDAIEKSNLKSEIESVDVLNSNMLKGVMKSGLTLLFGDCTNMAKKLTEASKKIPSLEANNLGKGTLDLRGDRTIYIKSPQENGDATGSGDTENPTNAPTTEPTVEPTNGQTEEPTEKPTEKTTEEPTERPTEEPTEKPTEEPTEEPTEKPTEEATEEPTEEPTPETPRDPEETQMP